MKRTATLTAGLVLAMAAPAAATHRPGHVGGGNAGRLSIKATPSPVVFGSATVISGKLTGNNSGGQQVTLTEDPFPYGDGYVNPLTANTDGNGDYSFRVVPPTNRNYRAQARGEQAFVSVRVRMRVGLSVSDRTPRRGQRVRFSGSVAPKHDGRTVLIQRLSRTGVWGTVRRTLLKPAPSGDRSVYSTRIRIFRSGSFRARVSADGDHLAGTSRVRVLSLS